MSAHRSSKPPSQIDAARSSGGGLVFENSVENSACRPSDVVQAFEQEYRVALMELKVVGRGVGRGPFLFRVRWHGKRHGFGLVNRLCPGRAPRLAEVVSMIGSVAIEGNGRKLVLSLQSKD